MTDLDASLDGTDFSTVYFEIGRYFDKLMPRQKKTKLDISGIQGYKQLKKKFLPRDIQVLGILYADTKAQLVTRIEDFAEFCYSDDPVQLIFNDKSDRYYLVEFDDTNELQKRGQFVPMKLQFTADDPFGYAVTADDDTQTGVVVKDTTWNITNNGQTYAFPTITITFNQEQTHIYIENNSISDNRFDISKAFNTNDILVINSKTGVITLNGSYSPAGFGDGGDGIAGYILLGKDINQLQIGTDDDTIDVDVNTNFRKVYL